MCGKAGYAPGLTNTAPLETVQTALDFLLPGNGAINSEFDNSMIEYSNLRMTVVGNLKLSLMKAASKLKPRMTLKPRLRTSCAPPRQPTMRQGLLALNKRNLGVVHVSAPQGHKAFARDAFSHMMDTFAVPDWRAKLRAMDPIVPNLRDLQEWFDFQSQSTKRAVEKMEMPGLLEKVKTSVADYEFILKSEPKVSVEVKPQHTYPTVQTVMFHRKEVNAFFGPMVREADRRFRSVLRDNVLYNKGKNLDDIEGFLSDNYQPGAGNVIVENDFSDYDRSQAEVAYALDFEVLSAMGLNPGDLETWMAGHYKHANISYALGIVVYLQYQRKSGDVTTAFGNTVHNMAALAWSLRLNSFEVLAAMFLGDDSWFQLVDSPSMRTRINGCSEEIAMRFNGEAKTAYFRTGYFCGNYILSLAGKVFLAADPIKRAVKLGRWDIKEASLLKENWVSYCDLMRNYEREDVQEALVRAVEERHPKGVGAPVKGLVESLYTLRKSFAEFKKLWAAEASTTFY